MIGLLEQRMASLHADPLWHFLNDRLKVRSRLGAILLAWAVAIVLTFVVPALTGFLLPRPGTVSALEDWPTFLIDFLTVPLVYAYYVSIQPDMIRRLIQGLTSLSWQADSQSQHQAIFSNMASRLAWRGWFPLAFVVAIVGTTSWVIDVLGHPMPTYYSSPRIMLVLHVVRVVVPLYMIIIVLVRHLVVTAALFVYFRVHSPRIHALHPDHCGGLAFLGDFSLRGAYLIAVIALNLSFLVLHNAYILHQPNPLGDVSVTLAGIAYLILAPLAFFLPLAPAHEGMSKARVEAETLIADEANRLYVSIQSDLRQSKIDAAAIARLDDLNRLSKLTSDFPVWPFDIRTMGRFVTAVILPLVPALVVKLVEMIITRLGG